jgi:hypothetical protein
MLGSMMAGLVALFWVLRVGVGYDPERACRIPLFSEEGDADIPGSSRPRAARGEEGAAMRQPLLSARVLMVMVGLTLAVFLMGVWIIVRAQSSTGSGSATDIQEMIHE